MVLSRWAQRLALGLLLGAFLVAPSAYVLAEAFFPGGRFGLGLFAAMARNPVLMRSLWNSLIIAVAATALATALALPFAALLGRWRVPGRGLLRAGVMIPLLLPPFAGAVAIRQVLGRYGSLNLILQQGGLIRDPIDWLGGGMAGVIFLEGLHLFPILYFSLVNHFAALNGDAMGVGFEFALAADIRVGERADHRYGLIETRLGIVPGGTGLTRMARMIGPGNAMLLGAGARALTPEEAYEAGLLELLEDDALTTATELAERMATLPRAAVAMAKKIVYQSLGVPLSVALDFELDSAYRAKQSAEAAPALRDYLAQPLERRRAWFER